ncbi:MAG: alpha/beta fold hydrolase [Christensenellales bacterium]|nr:alpha/beta hydrolase [Clostridiales bacterium]
MKELTFTSFDGYRLHCALWEQVKEPKGIIQLIHGMTSYGLRYDDFAKKLNQAGYIVFADDHRGHGLTAGKDKLGQVDKNNFFNCVKDQIGITKMLREKYGLPVQLFAHSYGSFLAQRYIQLAGEKISGVILSGSSYMGGKKLILGKIITSLQRLFFGDYKKDKLLYNMTYKANNKPFLSDNLDNAWLNRDLEKVKQYNSDPLCGYIVSIGFYYSMMRGLIECYKEENIAKIPKDLPILIMSGALDPLGGMGEKVKKLYEMYKSYEIKNLSLKIYDNVRHELTGDPEQDKIIADMLDFYNGNIQ